VPPKPTVVLMAEPACTTNSIPVLSTVVPVIA